MAISAADLTQIEQWCSDRTGETSQDVLVIAATAGNSVTLVERRPDWMDASAPWLETPAARLTPRSGEWQLRWFDGSGRARLYDPPTFASLDDVLDAIEQDPDGAIWG